MDAPAMIGLSTKPMPKLQRFQMGDEKDEYQIWLDEWANISINDSITVSGSDMDFKYEDWLAQYDTNIDLSSIDVGSYYPGSTLGANDIKLNGGGEEMLRVAQDGFYVRGVKVEADEKEAKAVYEAFKQWMTYAILNGEINN